MRRYPKLECPFLGCKGEIDLVAQARDALFYGTSKRIPRTVAIPWSITTIICPRCHNAVAQLDIFPGTWISPDSDLKKVWLKKVEDGKSMIFAPNTGEYIPVRNEKKALNPYLKKWARFEHIKKKRNNIKRRGGPP